MSETKRGLPSPKPKRRTRAKKTEAPASSPDPVDEVVKEVSSVSHESPLNNDDRQELTASAIIATETKEPLSERMLVGKESAERSPTATIATGAQLPPKNRDDGRPKSKPTDDYSLHVHFDRSQKTFIASVLEFPELRAAAPNREQAMRDLDRKLEQALQNAKRKNEPVVEPLQLKRYPERLEVAVSQSLFRKLDLLSRQEKVSIDQLAVEILSVGVERRKELPKKGGQPHDRRPPHPNNNHQQSQPGNQRHGNNQQRGRQGQNRNYHDTMDNRENFMEYVRNLEKGGGTGWRKK